MTSILQQGSSLGSCPTFSCSNSLYNQPYVKSSLVGGRDKYTHSSCDSWWARKVICTSYGQSTPPKALSAAVARDTQLHVYPTTAAFLIQIALLRTRPLLVFSLHFPSPASPAVVPATSSYQYLQTSPSFSSSSCTFQHLQSSSCATKLPAPLADQLHLAADFSISSVYEQPLLGPTQHTEATSTYLQLTKVPHNRVSLIVWPLQPVTEFSDVRQSSRAYQFRRHHHP